MEENKVLNEEVEEIWDANPDGCPNCNKGYKGRIAIQEVLEFDDTLDFDDAELDFDDEIEDEEVEDLIRQRTEARKNKDWGLADKIRDDLKARGIVLEDTPDGVKWKFEK